MATCPAACLRAGRSFELLGGLKCWAVSRFGSVANMFRHMDASGGGDLSWKEFSRKLVDYCTEYDIELDITEIQSRKDLGRGAGC